MEQLPVEIKRGQLCLQLLKLSCSCFFGFLCFCVFSSKTLYKEGFQPLFEFWGQNVGSVSGPQ